MNGSISSHDAPLISVVMTAYNAERFLAEAINSILAQTYSHLELVIVDDGSTDGSAGIVREFAARDARIRPFFTENRRAPRARNLGVASARGELIAHLDHDDIALPGRLAAQLDWMRQTGVDVCGSCAKLFGAEERLVWYPEKHADIQREFLFHCAMMNAAVLLRADIAKANPYDEQAAYGDYELFTRLASRYRLGNVPQVLVKTRRHARQRTFVYPDAIRRDFGRFRERHFYALYPAATADDCATLSRIAERESSSNLAEVQRAGKWLARLAQTSDRYVREQMARRWLATCLRSAHLGLGCYRAYRRVAPQFGVMPAHATFKVALACALQLKSGSRLGTALRWVNSETRRRRRPL